MKVRIRNRVYFSDCILFFIIIMPIVDCINGYFQETPLSVIGPIYRLLMILLTSCVIAKCRNKKNLIFTFGVSSYFLLHDLIFIIFDSKNNNISILTERTLKYIYVILLIEALCVLITTKKINLEDIENVLGFLSWLYPILLIFPKLIGASGTNMYSDSGYKGFYYSGNAVSIAMVFSLFVAMNFLYKKPNLKNSFRAILCLAVQLLIGAKTNYIFVVLILGFFAFKVFNISKLKNLKTLVVLGVLILAGIVSIKYWFADEIAKIIARQNYLFSAYDRNWIQYLTSNRSIRIEEQLIQFNNNPINIVFGMGYRQASINNFVEMDFFDLLFRYGLIITVVLILFYFSFLKQGSYEKTNYLILYLIMLAFAMVVGHVFCDAMSGTLMALVIASLKCNYNNEKCRGFV